MRDPKCNSRNDSEFENLENGQVLVCGRYGSDVVGHVYLQFFPLGLDLIKLSISYAKSRDKGLVHQI